MAFDLLPTIRVSAEDPAPHSPTPSNYQRTTGGHLKWRAPTPERLQEMLPGYEVIMMLGAGGMGAVYKGRQRSLDRLVAIKILPPEAAGDEESKFVERFKNEARTMAKLNHPGIVNVYDFGETSEGQLYFVMEFVDGTDVAKMILSQGKLPPEHALAITAHVCDALAYAHKHGVVHRDIKPANVLINMEGAVKVADFGLARMEEPGQSSGLTKTGVAMGTPDFVSPEALVMGSKVDGRADLYAVGVMLYNMLTGEVPRGFFQLPSQKTGSDPRFDGIVRRAMEQDREQRYQTAAEVRRDLDVILTMPLVQAGGQSSAAIPMQKLPPKPVASGPAPRQGKGAPANQLGREQKAGGDESSDTVVPASKKNLGPIIGIAATAVIAAGLFFFFKHKTPPAPTASNAATPPASSGTMKPAPKATPKVASPLPPQPPSPGPLPVAVAKQTIDLLALTDPAKDRIPVPSMVGKNEWKREGTDLVFQSDGKSGKLAAPVAIMAKDYEIEFRAVQVKGKNRIHMDVPLGGGRIVPITLNGQNSRVINDREGESWGPWTSFVHVKVRVIDGEGPRDRIVVTRVNDSAILADWFGWNNSVAKAGEAHPDFPTEAVPSVFVRDQPYAVEKWTLSVFDGRAKVLRESATPLATNSQPAQIVPPTGFLTFNGHLYLLMMEPTDLKGAAKTASDLGGHLATITSQAEHDFLVNAIGRRLAPRTQIWLGGLLKPADASFTRWDTGEEATFQNWADGMAPDKRPVRDLRLFATSPDLRWGQTHSKSYAFLVEWDDDVIPPAKSADPASLIGWNKALPDLAEEITKKGGKGAAADGSIVVRLGTYPLLPAPVADVAVRGRYQGKFDLMLRGDGTAGIRLRFHDRGMTVSRIAPDGKTLSEDRGGAGFTAPSEHRFIAAAAGKALRVWMDDTLVADLALPSAETGQVHVASFGPPVTIHELELALIPGNFTTLPLVPAQTPKLAANKPEEPAPPPQAPAALIVPDDPRMAQLEAGFQAACKRDAHEPHDKAIATLNQSYLGAIGRSRAAAQAQGSLVLVTALDAEKARITSGQALPPEDVGGTPEALIQLRQTYRATAAKHAADRDKAIVPLYDKYLAALDAYVAELTRTNAIEKATTIKTFRDALATKKPVISDNPSPVAPTGSKALTEPKSSAANPSAADIRGSTWTAAAKWVLSVGGTLQGVRNGKQFPINSEKDVLGGRFDIAHVDIRANPNSASIKDDDFSRLAPLKELKSIRLDGIQAGDAAFAFVRTTPALTSFAVTANDKVTDAVFEHLAAAKEINSLQFQKCSRITGVGLAKLACLPKLDNVWLSTGLTDAGLKELAPAVAITNLVLGNTNITDEGLEVVLPQLRNLKNLDVQWCPGVTGSSFVHLKGLTVLTVLSWGHEKGSKTMNPEALAFIGACPSLLRLLIDSVPITDADLHSLAPLRNVYQLALTRSKVTGTGFAALTELKQLVNLNLGYETPITGEGLKAIAAALPQLEHLHLGVGAKLSTEDFRTFGTFKSLKDLILNGSLAVTDDALAAMELPPTLERLDMQGSPITSAGLARWKAPAKLAHLNLHACDALDDTAIPHLKKLTTLDELLIQRTGITDAGAAELRKALPNCNVQR